MGGAYVGGSLFGSSIVQTPSLQIPNGIELQGVPSDFGVGSEHSPLESQSPGSSQSLAGH